MKYQDTPTRELLIIENDHIRALKDAEQLRDRILSNLSEIKQESLLRMQNITIGTILRNRANGRSVVVERVWYNRNLRGTSLSVRALKKNGGYFVNGEPLYHFKLWKVEGYDGDFAKEITDNA